VPRSGHRALDKNDSIFWPNVNDLKITSCLSSGSEVTGHLFTREDASRISGRADGTWGPVRSTPMSGRPAGKAMAFHHPGKTATLGRTGDMNLLTDLKNIKGDFLPNLVILNLVNFELFQDSKIACARGTEVPGQGTIYFISRTKTKL